MYTTWKVRAIAAISNWNEQCLDLALDTLDTDTTVLWNRSLKVLNFLLFTANKKTNSEPPSSTAKINEI